MQIGRYGKNWLLKCHLRLTGIYALLNFKGFLFPNSKYSRNGLESKLNNNLIIKLIFWINIQKILLQ